MLDKVLHQVSVLEKGLDAAWQKNEIIAANMANADTPGYKALRADFASVFQEALEADALTCPDGTGPADLDALSPRIYRDGQTSMRMDGNNVDVDREMTDLVKNTLIYDTIAYAASKEIGRLKIIVTEGK